MGRLVLPALLLAASPALAAPQEMTAAADLAGACAAIRGSIAPAAPCKVISKVGSAQLISIRADMIAHYAIVIQISGTLRVSEPIEIIEQNCGMMKCDHVDRVTPALRVLGNGAVALELAMQLHHEVTRDDGTRATRAITERWDQTSMLVCDPNLDTCLAREWGGRGNSCRVKLAAATGQVTATCVTTEPYF